MTDTTTIDQWIEACDSSRMDSVIEARDLTKSYPGGEPVLRGVSLTVNRGNFVALVGRSGSGKSTLLHILGGLDKPSSGEVTVFGTPLHQAREADVAALRNQKIGFVFQAFHLLEHLTCLENVALSSQFAPTQRSDKQNTERAAHALERVGLSDFRTKNPGAMSGGQKQRVAIARALFASPELLLCDEPTGNLDAATGQSILEFFCELVSRDKLTLLVVTHEKRVSSLASHVIALRDGLVVPASSAEEAA